MLCFLNIRASLVGGKRRRRLIYSQSGTLQNSIQIKKTLKLSYLNSVSDFLHRRLIDDR